MTEALFQPDWLSRPGDTISTLMSRRGFHSGHLAMLMGRERRFVHGLLAGSIGINNDIAASLSKHLGGSATFWRTRQRQFDLALDQAVSALPPERAKEWLRLLPLRDMLSAGWVAHAKGREALRSALAYFGVSGPDDWKSRYTSFANAFSYRSSPTYGSKLGALSAWLRQAEIEAEGSICVPWSADQLRANVNAIRRLTKLKNPASFIPKLKALCADAGVSVVFVRAPSGCRASGATRFVSVDKAVIVLSFRHLSDDHFWFTLFHEIGHLLLHGRDATFIDGEAATSSAKEKEANDFSSNVLIPSSSLEAFHSLRGNLKSIVRFAVSIDIAPGIVVGQMQHNQLLGPAQMNSLKRRYKWDDIQAALD
ncbi:MAG: ImmA/IrrE family metallo-endopeptidase [Hyphomicrobium sp.]|uniref:ImmA/IrrE family metallo-endopeptidase n=1 Tax=Hyphomicrobium sp. TaxID=82 RepID=UPI001321AEAA|nr:ImmA/IrrE family metallo-endopeptidase [Hyphomicrobium sp.]KAB2940568.1 MAG: ImmA/IrrE family metallo-endopeptidase [Hyphomicrobium sp.]MBZ0208337.1 ImmA/IrrE family metallo-endopeptidase [Hyphomicrobium sp.]